MTVVRSRTLSISIDRPPRDVYDFVSNPENLPKWAPGFCRSVRKSAGEWIVETADGPMTIAFVARNELGVLDHAVTVVPGVTFENPMRVIRNASGSELIFTLFQTPDVSDEKFRADAGLVERDLRTLKDLLEARG